MGADEAPCPSRVRVSATVFLAVLLAALLHAAWNAMVKGGRDKDVAMLAVVLGSAPFGAVAILVSPPPLPASWGYIALGAAVHCGYQLFLLAAYRMGDFTQVYPVARGSAPLIVAGVSVLLVGHALDAATLLGVALISGGLIAFALARALPQARALLPALATGAFIATYSLTDGLGARLAGTALGFYGWETVLNSVVAALAIAAWRPALLGRTWREGRGVALAGGGASFAAYAIVVWAFTEAPIAAVTALRETSIVFAMVIGVVVLRERVDWRRIAAAALTLAGAVTLRFAR